MAERCLFADLTTNVWNVLKVDVLFSVDGER